MLEHRSQKLLPRPQWLLRLVNYTAMAASLIGFGLGIGAVGYHYAGGFRWLDAAFNAAMILTGMGPVDRLDSDGAKLFAMAYAVFSQLVFLGSIGVLVAPWAHRLLHIVNAEVDDGNS